MANELKPCPFCGGKAHYTKEILSAGLAAVVMCSDNDCCTNHAETLQKAIDLWNTRSGTLTNEGTTRPAAPVEGLDTVEYQVYDAYGRWQSVRKFVFDLKVNADHRELVTRSQAEAIIAAKDALIAKQQKLLDHAAEAKMLQEADNAAVHNDMMFHVNDAVKAWNKVDKLEDQLEKAETDNAALTARVKELEDYAREATKAITGLSGGGSENFGKAIGDLYPADLPFCLKRIQERYVSKVELKRLETQLAAARKALEPFSDHAKERVVDEPEWRDNHTVQIVVTIGELRQARAALEAKP